MFKVYADELCFYNDESPESSLKLISPKLSLADNSAGSFTFTLPPCNVAYDYIKRLTTYIYIYRDNVEIWSGRPIAEDKDFQNNRVMTCEGRLAFLVDTVQLQKAYSSVSLRVFMEQMIAIHNSKVDSKRKFTVGTVSESLKDKKNNMWCTDYESTYDCISKKLDDAMVGHFRVRKDDGVYKLDFLTEDDIGKLSAQSIEFGNNLQDFTQSFDLTSLATVIIPLGARVKKENNSVKTLFDERVTVPGTYVYVKDENGNKLADTLGRIEAVVEWSDMETSSGLQAVADNYIKSERFENVVLTISAVDLHYLNPEIEAFELMDKVRCVSKPHSMDKIYRVTGIDIPLDNPSQTVYTLGGTEKRSFTALNGSASTEIHSSLSSVRSQLSNLDIPDEDKILQSAKDNASEIINKLTGKSYVTLERNSAGNIIALYVSDAMDYNQSTGYWKWNDGGLAYFKRTGTGRYESPFVTAALTKDGHINAEYLTAIFVSAANLTTGTIASHKYGGTGLVTEFNLDKGYLKTGNVIMADGKLSVGDGSGFCTELIAGGMATYQEYFGHRYYNAFLHPDAGVFALSNSSQLSSEDKDSDFVELDVAHGLAICRASLGENSNGDLEYDNRKYLLVIHQNRCQLGTDLYITKGVTFADLSKVYFYITNESAGTTIQTNLGTFYNNVNRDVKTASNNANNAINSLNNHILYANNRFSSLSDSIDRLSKRISVLEQRMA